MKLRAKKQRDNIIQSIFSTIVSISEKPAMILDNSVFEMDDLFFKIKVNNSLSDVCRVSRFKPLIEVNYNLFIKLKETTRIFVLLWSAFSYFSDLWDSIMVSSFKVKNDSATVEFMRKNGVFNKRSYSDLISDFKLICSTPDSTRRI